MLVLVWLGSLSFSCLPLVTGYEFHPGTNFCSPAWHRSCGLYAFMTVFAFGIPLITLLSTYGMIFSSIRRHTKRVSHWRVSTSDSGGKKYSARTTDITGRGIDSFLSNSGVEEEEQRNFIKVKEACPDQNTPDNSMGDFKAIGRQEESIKSKVLERHHDKKFRSHSAGCQHARTEESLLPLFLQMKSAAKAKETEKCYEPDRPRSCSVSVQFSINGLVPGTVSAFFCPDNSMGTEQIARSLSLSYCNLHSIQPNELVASEAHPFGSDAELNQPSDLNYDRIPSHSISLTVTTTSSPVSPDIPDLNVPASSSVNRFTPEEDSSAEKLRAVQRPSDVFKTASNSNNWTGNPHHLQLPPIAIPASPVYPVQLGKTSLPEPVPRPKSRSRSLSFGTLPEKSDRNSTLLEVPPANKTSSPLLRLRAISKFKSRLRVNSIPREYKIAKIGFILVLVFFLSWGPYMMVHNCQPSSGIPLWVYRMAMWLVYLSCVLNPIVYALSSKHIRTAFSSHMKCCKMLHIRKSLAARQRAATK